MLYQCQTTYIDLARVVTVSDIRNSTGMKSEGGMFNIGLTGIDAGVWIKACDRQPQTLMALVTCREALIANWQRFKGARPGGEKIVYQLGDLHINLLAVTALSCTEKYMRGHSHSSGNNPTDDGYTVYIMGMREPVQRRVGRTAIDKDALLAERDALLTAWASLHTLPQKGAA